MKSYLNNIFSKLSALLGLLMMGSLAATADNKVYISDFSIEVGEEKEIAINFDTDATDIIFLQGTVKLPEGLTIVKNAYGNNKNAKADGDRADGFNAQINGTTGKFSILSTTGDGFTGTTGAVATFKVKAAAELAPTSVIEITDVSISPAGTVATQSATVTCTNSTIEINMMSADPSEVALAPGKTAEVAISLANMTNELEGFSAHLTLPDGVTAEIVSGGRTSGKINYSAASGNIFKVGAISGNDGVLFTIKLTASATFEAPATIVLDEIALSTSDASTSIDLDNVTISVVAQATEVNTMTADPTEIELAPGLSKEVTISLNNETNELEGFSAHLTLPDGIIAEIVPGNRTSGKINYSAASGNIFKIGAISGNDGVLFTIKLTASDTFAGSSSIVLDEIALSTSDASSSIDLEDVVVNVTDISKDLAKQALSDEIAAATTLLGDDDKTVDPGKSLSDAIVAAQAVADKADATVEELNAATAALKTAEEAYQAAKDAEAAAALAAAKAALQDEITKATELLGDDDKTVDPGKSLSDAIAAAQAVADKADATVEELNDATEALKDAEEAYQAAKETESDLEAAKAELAAEIQKATELLGDDDQTVDPGKWLKESIDVAQAVLDDPNATLEEVQNATEALKTVEDLYKDAKQEQAEIAAAKAELAAEIQKATELLGNTDTTTDPGKSLKEAIDEAQAVLDDPTAVLVEVVSAIENLKDAEETFKNTPTAIGTLHNNKSSNGEVYNLNGVRVNHQYRGIYIVNGKKVAK